MDQVVYMPGTEPQLLTSKSLRSTARNRPSQRGVDSHILAVLIFIATELMFFSGFISAYNVTRSKAMVWPPPDQPRLPIEVTAVNTFILLLSGIMLLMGIRTHKNAVQPNKVLSHVGAALALAVVFVCVQGYEWVRLIDHGLRLTSSIYGSFFYVIIGTHALHAIGGIIALGIAVAALAKDRITYPVLVSVSYFWFFVVGIWPVLYVLVYLW